MNSKKLSATLLTLLTVVALPSLAGATPTRATPDRTPVSSGPSRLLSTADELAISQAFEDYGNGFIEEDAQMLLDLWDTTDDLSYLPVESDTLMEDLSTLSTYYQALIAGITIHSAAVTGLRIFPRGTDEAYVYGVYNWVYSYKPSGPVMSQPTRATFVMKKRNGQWRYVHFHESIRLVL